MIIALPLLFALVGLLMYALCANPKLQEIGRITYFAGLLAFLLMSGRLVQLLPKTASLAPVWKIERFNYGQ